MDKLDYNYMVERERHGQYFPVESGGQMIPLPDYVTLTLENGTEVQVHPSRVDEFLRKQEEIKEKG